MTWHPVHNEPFCKTTTDSFANRLISRPLIAGSFLVAGLIGVSFGMQQFRFAYKALAESSHNTAVSTAGR